MTRRRTGPDWATPGEARKAAVEHHEPYSDPVQVECSQGCGTTRRRCYRLGAVINGRRPVWWCEDCVEAAL